MPNPNPLMYPRTTAEIRVVYLRNLHIYDRAPLVNKVYKC